MVQASQFIDGDKKHYSFFQAPDEESWGKNYELLRRHKTNGRRQKRWWRRIINYELC